jgi:hypothetical protein
MSENYKSNIVISFLIAIVSGLLLLTFHSEAIELTRAIRENLFETFAVLLLITILILVLQLHLKINVKNDLK